MYEYVTGYDPETREGGLFAGHIDTFLKLLEKASGYPEWFGISPDEERYIQSLWNSEGIQLDRESIKPNADKIGLAKIFLNSMWCRLTERIDGTPTTLIT